MIIINETKVFQFFVLGKHLSQVKSGTSSNTSPLIDPKLKKISAYLKALIGSLV